MCNALIFTIVTCLNMFMCAARPTGDDEFSTNLISDNRLAKLTAESGQFKYLLPTMLTEGMIIIIEGTLNTNHETFSAKLPSCSPDSTDADCELVYNFSTHKLDITPASSPDHEAPIYSMDVEPGKSATFKLRLKARHNNGNQIIDFTFEGNNNGPSETLACKIKSFTDIDHIIMKGVESVESLLFEFPK